ncbi:hypothetical protein A7K91_14260 [Paenibacillus oryzae]|uniref:Glycosyltransferase 2-like domain-containing protein n=1 Tax=Paenibacillus oryzae TaxID=1844972 RepID=A0A1A5YJI3_9BACL|nr:glycosyltransferase [Paenibacillus oryzae]OBR65723.1 hypothetical protein A7K91_14260 [Paenibacillus oryzae]
MTLFITPELAARFQQFGRDTYIQSGGYFNSPEQIAIGNGVFMRSPYQFDVMPSVKEPPVISVDDGCQINLGLRIKAKNRVRLERNVLIGPHVCISDEVDLKLDLIRDEFIPGINAGEAGGQVVIGEGAWIGANAIIQGNVRIGNGSIVKANSVVLSHVPDYCAVSGCPAKIVQIYEPSSSSWIDVSSPEQAAELLSARRLNPLLSICIPTYNRANHLEHCLDSIYSQIGNNELFEVIVSDNASTDATPEIAQRYAARYSNMKYIRNAKNIGADPNIFQVMKLARGKFVKIQGDDDFYVEGTLYPLLNVVHSHGDCGVIHIYVRNGDGRIWTGEGMSAYLEATSIYATFITSTILRRDELEKIKTPDLFLQSSFNQLYLQYAIMENNPRFCVMNSCMFTYAGISSDAYNFGEVVLRSYQSILQHFVGRGLTMDDFLKEKKRTLYNYAIPWFRQIITTKMIADTDRFEEIYSELYRDEPYYEDALAIIASVRNSQP